MIQAGSFQQNSDIIKVGESKNQYKDSNSALHPKSHLGHIGPKMLRAELCRLHMDEFSCVSLTSFIYMRYFDGNEHGFGARDLNLKPSFLNVFSYL